VCKPWQTPAASDCPATLAHLPCVTHHACSVDLSPYGLCHV